MLFLLSSNVWDCWGGGTMTDLSARCFWTDRGRVSPPRANVDKGSYGEFRPSMKCKVTCAEVHRPSIFYFSEVNHGSQQCGVWSGRIEGETGNCAIRRADTG